MVRQAYRSLPVRSLRGAQEKEAEMSEALEDRRRGYGAAQDDLRMLLGKVPEEQWVGVVAAWLHEGDYDD